MIVRILSSGTSFKGLATYLTHDPDAQTQERVGWTHTHNLANDHVPSAVDEMVWTARNAELLKQEAGIRAGGRSTENSAKHLSLNWSPQDNPTREHMIETTEQFLHHMKWQEHQAIIVAHDDKAHRHVHCMINMVHPETGLRLDDNFERRRAQAWALEYEREQGRVYCEQRLKTAAEREDAPPRNMWLAFQKNEKDFENSEKSLRQQEPIVLDEHKNPKNAEWQLLKQIQRDERSGFFAEGKIEFSQLRLSIYREVRDEFRDRWADFYAARKDGADPENLATLKAELVADQKGVLDARRDEACKELRESRDGRYHELLDHQREIRAGLRGRQEAGLDNALFLQQAEYAGKDMSASFREAAVEAGTPRRSSEAHEDATVKGSNRSDDIPSIADRDDVGLRVGVSVGSLFDALFFDLTTLGSTPAQRETPNDPAGRDPLQVAADEAVKQQQHRQQEEADAEWRQKQRPL
jgi:hypothetical protein